MSNYIFFECLDLNIAENGDGEIVIPSWCLSGNSTPSGICISKCWINLAMNINIFDFANVSPRHLLLPNNHNI